MNIDCGCIMCGETNIEIYDKEQGTCYNCYTLKAEEENKEIVK